MRPFVYTITPAATSANSIAASQKPGGAGNLTLATTTLDYARKLAIASDATDTGITFLVTGTDQDGNVISESIAGPDTASENTVKYYKTITSIHVSAGTTGNITVGTSALILSKTLPLEFRSTVAPEVALIFSGTANVTINNTFDDVLGVAGPYNWIAVGTALTSKAANTYAQVGVAARGVQLQVNSYSSTPTVTMTVVTPRQLC